MKPCFLLLLFSLFVLSLSNGPQLRKAPAAYIDSFEYTSGLTDIYNTLESPLSTSSLRVARYSIQLLLTAFQVYQNQHNWDPSDQKLRDSQLFQASYNEAVKAYNKAVRSIPAGVDGSTSPLIDYYYEKDQAQLVDGDVDPEPFIEEEDVGDKWSEFQLQPPEPDSAAKEKIFQFQCLKALADSLPAPFCWASKLYRPKSCPAEYPYRKATACHKKDTIFSRFITFFNSKVLCDAGDKKVLGCCESLDRCSRLGYIDCGLGACAITKSACAKEVSSMVVSSISGLVKLSAFIASMGASSAASSWVAVVEVFNDIKKYAGYALSAINTIVSVTSLFLEKFDSTTMKNIKGKIIASALNKAKRYLPIFKISKTDLEITQKLSYVFENIQQVRKETQSMSESIAVKIRKAVSDKIADVKRCFQSMKSDVMKGQLKDVMCYKDYILPVISLFDPTGVSGIVSAFIYPKCPAQAADWTVN